MIQYNQFYLDNGLEVIVHEDPSTPMAIVNLLYRVGSRDESPERTGFAHLFEHLMFGGSHNIPSFDQALQKVGGSNNAFTSPDVTNYYDVVPAQNIETAFWLESDRMLSLVLSDKSLEVQRKVVIEEFKQRYLNQPYGDLWLKLRPTAYKTHPYQWATIGKKIEHIEEATLNDVQGFFKRFYNPSNAILVVAGNVKLDEVKRLSEKWFGPIPAGPRNPKVYTPEALQTEARELIVEGKVPLNGLYKAFHMCGKNAPEYVSTDLLSDILGRGQSSRLHQKLVKEQKLFNDAGAYILGSEDPGLFIIGGKLNRETDVDEAENAVQEVIDEIIRDGAQENELEKVKNLALSSQAFGDVQLMNRALTIAFAANSERLDDINNRQALIENVKLEECQQAATKVLTKENCSTLKYLKID